MPHVLHRSVAQKSLVYIRQNRCLECIHPFQKRQFRTSVFKMTLRWIRFDLFQKPIFGSDFCFYYRIFHGDLRFFSTYLRDMVGIWSHFQAFHYVLYYRVCIPSRSSPFFFLVFSLSTSGWKHTVVTASHKQQWEWYNHSQLLLLLRCIFLVIFFPASACHPVHSWISSTSAAHCVVFYKFYCRVSRSTRPDGQVQFE